MVETRTCSDCGETQTLDAFYRSGRKVQSRCKPCFNRMCVERWRRIKAEEVARLGGRCQDCEGTFHPDVYDFHHIDPSQKEHPWTKLRLLSATRRRRELDRCVLLCANCHRMRHVVS